jgi:histidyl-tRNA synthetase
MSADSKKTFKPKARVAKGFRDVGPDEIRGLRAMIATIQGVYESYGFEPVEQPFVEYTEALGKFLPDQDRPNAGVFSFQDDDEQWLSLRYDLTAPLARYVAENNQKLPTPFRSYRQGWVFRNEKPGPGRYRQFMQFDADTVGSSSPAADAEVCMMAADTMEALGIPSNGFSVRVYSRKVIDGIFESIGLSGAQNSAKRLTALRAIDKLDKFGIEGVKLLLGTGRKDDSGDFTEGAKLERAQIDKLTAFFVIAAASERALKDMRVPSAAHGATGADLREYERIRAEGIFGGIANLAGTSAIGLEGMAELRQIWSAVTQAGYSDGRIRIDPSIIRGLEYYTGPVFECELLMETNDEDGKPVRFGSVGGGGRYDDLVARFTGQQVPATGFSIGVSRLYSALELLKKNKASDILAPVVVTVMDKERQGDYWKLVQTLRHAGIRAEMYIGTSNMQKQMKYADKRGSPLVIIQGGDEKAKGEVQIKNLRRGSELASEIESREEYASQRLAQVSVPEAEMVAAVKKALAR